MVKINNVCLIGRLATKPELRQTSNGIATTRFNLAVNRAYSGEKKQTDFIPIQVWRKQAENVCHYLSKGSQVSIEGRIQVDSYTDKQGNQRTLFNVVADNVHFLESKPKPKEQPKEELVDIYAEFGENIVEEDNFLD